MENLHANRAALHGESTSLDRNASGLWSIDGDRIVSVEDFEEGPAIVLVHSEHVLLLPVDLPPMPSESKRRAALPFAIEEQVAEPLEELHVALGVQFASGQHLAGVVRHSLMRRWVQMLLDAGLDQAALVPDCLALPVPGENSWSVDLAGERAMIRQPDGTGFAVPLGTLEMTWQAAGEPACVAYGDPLPANMAAPEAELEAPGLSRRLIEPALDLRQGTYRRPRQAMNPLWKRIAMVTALGAAAHTLIAAADTLALDSIADEREAEVRSLAQNVAPSLTLGSDLAVVVSDLGDPAVQGSSGDFLPLVSAAAAAFAQSEEPVTWRAVDYDEAGRALTVAIEATDISGLQRVASTLSAAGLEVRPGTATTQDGRAIASFTVIAR